VREYKYFKMIATTEYWKKMLEFMWSMEFRKTPWSLVVAWKVALGSKMHSMCMAM
jgi:hypothetical protein